jgi:hypothetical protein
LTSPDTLLSIANPRYPEGSMKLSPALVPALALGLLAVGCEQPPTKEITAAQQALAQARSDGAETLASEQFREAATAFADAERKAQAQDYRGALSAALDAAEKSRAASQAAGSARALARSAAELAEGEARIALDEVAEIRAQAAKAKVPDEAFEAVLPRLAEGQAAVEVLAKALADADLPAAQKAVAEVKDKTMPLPSLFREARIAWDAQKGKRPKRR